MVETPARLASWALRAQRIVSDVQEAFKNRYDAA
jgi:hypothetical protein